MTNAFILIVCIFVVLQLALGLVLLACFFLAALSDRRMNRCLHELNAQDPAGARMPESNLQEALLASGAAAPTAAAKAPAPLAPCGPASARPASFAPSPA
jgi:hypothetical protein